MVDLKLTKRIKKEAKEVLASKELGLTEEQKLLKQKKRKKNQKLRERRKKKWYKPKKNSSVYITNLPKDVTKEEILEFFKKAGSIRLDFTTGEEKIKIYEDAEGKRKGDGLVTYEQIESVEIALEQLDGKHIRVGCPVKVEKAVFKQKGEYRERKIVKIDPIAKIKYKGCFFLFLFLKHTYIENIF